jgi:hypothetical protein
MKWLNVSQLAKHLKTNHRRKLKKIAELYRQDNQGWFAEYFATRDFIEYYHPDLIKKIKKHFTQK